MKIKICGFTQPDNARDVAMLDIDAIGLVFYNKSPRNVDIETANKIIDSLPPFINRVGLFVNANPGFIDEVLCDVSLDTLQFHGDETPIECSQYAMPYIKAVRMQGDTNLDKIANVYSDSCGLLLDAFNKDAYGGTGEGFDYSLINTDIELPIILAGGLNAENVANAIQEVNPYAVDTSSGVESEKGIKDIAKIKQFIDKVRA